MAKRFVLAVIILAAAALAQAQPAADWPALPTAAEPYLTLVASGLSGPTAMAAPNDGSGRIFIVENRNGLGVVRVMTAHDNLLATPYFSRAVSGGAGSEQGMLGIAVDPDFASNGTLYLTYTAPASAPRLGSEPDQVLLRLVASNPAANVFAGSQVEVMRIPDLYANHNGGNIMFGPDNYLYWGMGDGGSGGDPNDLAQDLWKKSVDGKSYYLLGKMLRLDVRRQTASAAANMCAATTGQTAQYAIPADNPHVGVSGRCAETWLYGLRNPWRWSFDRANGDLLIADVGQSAWEEVSFRAAGAQGSRDYGWRKCEGRHFYAPPGSGSTCPQATGSVAPVITYANGSGDCSVTGGFVYRGPVMALRGKYLFSDYCSGKIYAATVQRDSPTWSYLQLPGTPSMNVYSFGEDTHGDVYVISGAGNIYRFNSEDAGDTIFRAGFEGF